LEATVVREKADLPDDSDREMVASTERGEWTSVGDIEGRRAFWREAAKGTIDGKRQRISISIP
jgi:hypothetical protein